MDLTSIIAVGATFLLGLGGVGVFVSKAVSKADRGLAMAKEILDVLHITTASLKDGKLSQEEVQSIAKEANEAIAEIKKGFKSETV